MMDKPQTIAYVQFPHSSNVLTSHDLMAHPNHTHALLRQDEWFEWRVYISSSNYAELKRRHEWYGDTILVEVKRIERHEAVERWDEIIEIMKSI